MWGNLGVHKRVRKKLTVLNGWFSGPVALAAITARHLPQGLAAGKLTLSAFAVSGAEPEVRDIFWLHSLFPHVESSVYQIQHVTCIMFGKIGLKKNLKIYKIKKDV